VGCVIKKWLILCLNVTERDSGIIESAVAEWLSCGDESINGNHSPHTKGGR
jgi:hypothetical protein